MWGKLFLPNQPLQCLFRTSTYYYYMKTNWPLNIYELNAIIASFVCAINPFVVICQYNKYIYIQLYVVVFFFFSCPDLDIWKWRGRNGAWVRVSWPKTRGRRWQMAHAALRYAKIFINLETNIDGHTRFFFLFLQVRRYFTIGKNGVKKGKITLHFDVHSIEMDLGEQIFMPYGEYIEVENCNKISSKKQRKKKLSFMPVLGSIGQYANYVRTAQRGYKFIDKS